MLGHQILIAALLFGCGLAHAALGDQPGGAPGATVRSSSATSTGASYTEVSRALAKGTVVREYADPSGTVFAVAWSGPHKPNLRHLLGSHFAAFRDAASSKEARANRGSRAQVGTGDLVVQVAGHMGAYEGRAWLASKLPAGFDTQEMK